MPPSPTTTRVLITVMTYPLPSREYGELVCTAGITQDGDWVRLYPVDYRHRPPGQQFRKYQWIEVDLDAHGAGADRRKESRRPTLASIRTLEWLSPQDRWRERREIIDALPHYTVKQLHERFDDDRTSLGIVRPSRILDLTIERDDEQWKPKWQEMYSQMRLFGPPPRPLRKIPYKFRYVFECEDSDKPHNAMIEDWELGVLWLKEVDRLGDEQAAADSVKVKFLEKMCAAGRDTRFYMGTVHKYNTWVVIGVFWPPRIYQESLF